MKCAVCQDTGEIQINQARQGRGEAKASIEGSYLKPCPFGCPVDRSSFQKTANDRLAGNEIKFEDVKRNFKSNLDALREANKMLKSKMKHIKSHEEGDYTIKSYSIPIEDYYGLNTGDEDDGPFSSGLGDHKS